MKIIGIIAEYNPFHNGHAYQIEKIKKDLQADFVVIAMSGNFVQRGAPAIMDKYARTEMALKCGADLVIELPVLWATASAEYFAMAGVTLFDKMGCVDGICFGAETNDLELLSAVADVLVEEPSTYRAVLSSYLKGGLAFPAARSKALCEYFASLSDCAAVSVNSAKCPDFNLISSILNEPNNILAIEYLKALKRRISSMTPYVIKREGAGYHDVNIADSAEDVAHANTCTTTSDKVPAPTASATAIRKVLNPDLRNTDTQLPSILTSTMPAPALEVLKEYTAECPLIHSNDFSSILGYQLLTSNIYTLADTGDSNPDVANRLFKNRMCSASFEQFCELNKSRDITYTRISRILMHLILNISNQDYAFGKELDYIPYLRILGFRKDSSVLLKELKTTCTVPIISKLADASSLLNANAMSLLEKDIFAADLYSQICACKKGNSAPSEYTRNIVRI